MIEYKDIKQILTSWMTPWMKDFCGSIQEHKFSLYLMIKYLKLGPIISKHGTFFSIPVLMFIHKHIIQQEEWYVFYNQSHLKYNKEYSNTTLEGTNNMQLNTHSVQHTLKWAWGTQCKYYVNIYTKITIKRAKHQINMVYGVYLPLYSLIENTHHTGTFLFCGGSRTSSRQYKYPMLRKIMT